MLAYDSLKMFLSKFWFAFEGSQPSEIQYEITYQCGKQCHAVAILYCVIKSVSEMPESEIWVQKDKVKLLLSFMMCGM